ncbi:hypothetical protein [Xenorhabdus sp. TH1]|uniref:hypothetical protein n=1 Tax=Xenorhabdus sp. TH1 TaxID=3130166 RepID=UPI0030D4476B
MADTKHTATKGNNAKAGNRKPQQKSYASVSFALHVDTEKVISLCTRRLFKASREAFTLTKNIEKYLIIPEEHMKSRTIAISRSLESVIGIAETELRNTDTHISNIIEAVRKERLEKTGKDSLLPLTYSNPFVSNIENRTYLGQMMCELILVLDSIIKNLDLCRHYSLVPVSEIVEAESNAIKRMKVIFNTIIRHNNTMTRLVSEYKDRKYNNVPSTDITVHDAAELSDDVVSTQAAVNDQ